MSRTRTRGRALDALTVSVHHLALTPGCGRVLARLSTMARPLRAEVDTWRRIRGEETMYRANDVAADFFIPWVGGSTTDRLQAEEEYLYRLDEDFVAAMDVLRRLDADLISLYCFHTNNVLEPDDPLMGVGIRGLHDRLVYALQLVPYIERDPDLATQSQIVQWPPGFYRLPGNAALREGLRGVVEAFHRDALPLLNLAHGRLVDRVALLERALSMDPSPDPNAAKFAERMREGFIDPFLDPGGFEGMGLILLLGNWDTVYEPRAPYLLSHPVLGWHHPYEGGP
jgi:hypothetical protein